MKAKDKISVFAVLKKDDKYLLVKRSKKVNNSGLWGLLGGSVDKQEDVKGALKRELFEESKLKVDSMQWLMSLIMPSGKLCLYFSVEPKNWASLSLNKEASKYKFCSLDEALDSKLHQPASKFFKTVKKDTNLKFRTQFINANLQQSIIAMDQSGNVVGSALITIPTRKLHNFRVEPKYRGLGYANEIMQHLLTLPNSPLQLTANADPGSAMKTPDLIKFYSKYGFKITAGNQHLARMQRNETNRVRSSKQTGNK